MSLSTPSKNNLPCPPDRALAKDRWIGCLGGFIVTTLLVVAFSVAAFELFRALIRALRGVP